MIMPSRISTTEPAAARVEHQEADAAGADDHLDGDQRAPAIAEAVAQAGDDVGQRAGQGDLPQHARPRGAEAARGARQIARHRFHAEHGVEHHRKQHGVDDDERHGGQAEAEPDQQDRQPGDVADGLEEQQDRPGDAVRPSAGADQDAKRNADRHADGGAGEQTHQAVLQIVRQDALVGQREERLDHLDRSRKERAREDAGLR